MTPPDFGADIDRMTAYCTYCPKMCRFSCPTAGAESRETVTPWGMMRLLEMAKDGSVPLSDEVADAFYHCTGCRRCQTFCEHDNDLGRALWRARRWVVDAGFLPEAYLDLVDRFDASKTPYGPPPEAPDESPFDNSAPVAFWPDCSTVHHHRWLVAAAGRLLKKLTGRRVRLITGDNHDHPTCCGFPLTGAGTETPDSCREKHWPELEGVEMVWTDCPALAAWHEPSSSWSVTPQEDEPRFGHLFALVADRVGEIEPDAQLQMDGQLVHESCYVNRQLDGWDQVETILSHICETPPDRMAYHGDESPCCGGRCHYRILEPDASQRAAETIVESLDRRQEADQMVTTSSMCHHAMDEAAEGDAIASLLALVCEAYDCLE